MKTVRELHTRAMDLAEAADIAKLRNDHEESKRLIIQAYEYEKRAFELIPDVAESEPTRSIIGKSLEALQKEALTSEV